MSDLFTWADRREQHACGACAHLDPKPIDSGIRYCRKLCMWRWAHDVVACAGYAVPA